MKIIISTASQGILWERTSDAEGETVMVRHVDPELIQFLAQIKEDVTITVK